MQGQRYSQKKNWLLAQSLVEFALVLPMLLLLILGAMDFGRMFYTKMVLTNAAREGANYLAYHQSDKDDGYVKTFAAIEAEVNSSYVEVGAEDVEYLDCCTLAEKVGVKITKTIDLIFDGILQSFGLLSGPVELTSTVWMVVQ
ncbi:MAG: TadE family protein [Chloroflexota bacterium]|nr:TadE family protein [Chloroflexota bacterium]